MCIGVPGQVLAVGDDIHQLAQVEVCGIKRDVNIALICEGKPADQFVGRIRRYVAIRQCARFV